MMKPHREPLVRDGPPSAWPHPNPALRPTRREWLATAGGGFAGLALQALMAAEAGTQPGHRPRARRVVQLFMAGGASHLDLFDYKPLLERNHGKPSDFGEPVEAFQDGLGPWLRPLWPFRPYGRSGRLLSDTVAPLGAVADDLAFIHNVVGRTGVHSQATLLQATGFERPGFPGMGCWVSYGLGSLNENLPTFVVMPDHRGLASNGSKNWDSAFLPGEHGGTVIYPGDPQPIRFLRPASDAPFLSPPAEAEARRVMRRLNRRHAAERPEDARLEARIRSYELAARMQLAAPEALDLSAEPEHVLRLYGLEGLGQSYPAEINPLEETHHFSRKCLAARRLLERGVRFVQVWSGNDNGFPRRNWDSHEDVHRDHGPLAYGMARGAAALIQDLKQRGMLDDTLVFWTTEFGRMPSSQGGKGRDHNPYCFTSWLCGGGIRGGIACGPSDEWGYKPADRSHPTQVYDLHATILHLMGVDHTRLTFRHDGIDRRLTDVHGHVIRELIA